MNFLRNLKKFFYLQCSHRIFICHIITSKNDSDSKTNWQYLLYNYINMDKKLLWKVTSNSFKRVYLDLTISLTWPCPDQFCPNCFLKMWNAARPLSHVTSKGFISKAQWAMPTWIVYEWAWILIHVRAYWLIRWIDWIKYYLCLP